VIAATNGLSLARYALGSAVLLAVLACLVGGAWRLRARLVPDWHGAAARLVEALLVLFAVTAIAEIFGAVNLLRAAPVAAAGAVTGLVMGALGRPGARQVAANRRAEPWWQVLAAGVAAALVAASWVSHTARALHQGMTHGDTLTYHGPFAARFLQVGTFGSLAGVGGTSRQFYPQNAELLHAVAALPYHRDLLSPLLNLGWAALAVLAAWCIGHRYGAGALAVLGTSVVLGLPSLAGNQPGQASNDVVCAALVVAAVALLLEGGLEPVPVALAGVAAGLAVGTKFTTIVPVVVLTIGVVALALRARRSLVALTWSVSLVAGGCYWFVRNGVVAGNPLTFVNLTVGPVTLHGANADTGAAATAMAHYLTDGTIWRTQFLPGLHDAFGPTWPLVLATVLVGAVLALLGRGPALVRLVGAATLAGLIAYPFTPLTAAASGAGFVFALRYLAPTLLLGFVLVALQAARARTRWQVAVVLAWVGLAVVNAFLRELADDRMPAWPADGNASGVVAGLLVIGVVVGLLVSRRGVPHAGRATVAALLIGTAVIVVAGGWFVQRRYFDGRYAGPGLVQPATQVPFRHIHDARVAVFGTPEVYAMFGPDLSNRVTTPTGPTQGSTLQLCRRWKRILSGHYDYVVLGHVFIVAFSPPQNWFTTDPAVVSFVRRPDEAVFHLERPLDPGRCPS
jgi:hypothetical protein